VGGSSSCRARVASGACRRSAPTPPPRAPSNAGPKPSRRKSRRSAWASPSSWPECSRRTSSPSRPLTTGT
jgi:hypothetical protein